MAATVPRTSPVTSHLAGGPARGSLLLLASLLLASSAAARQTTGRIVQPRVEAVELSTAGLTPGQLRNAVVGGAGVVPGATGTGGSPERPPCAEASTWNINPGAINPRVYVCDPPVIGSLQTHTVYFGPRGRYSMAIIRVHAWGTRQLLPGGQLLLVDPSSPKVLQLGPLTGTSSASITIRIPGDPSLCGWDGVGQAYLWDPTGTWPFVLSNAHGMFLGDS